MAHHTHYSFFAFVSDCIGFRFLKFMFVQNLKQELVYFRIHHVLTHKINQICLQQSDILPSIRVAVLSCQNQSWLLVRKILIIRTRSVVHIVQDDLSVRAILVLV